MGPTVGYRIEADDASITWLSVHEPALGLQNGDGLFRNGSRATILRPGRISWSRMLGTLMLSMNTALDGGTVPTAMLWSLQHT